MTEKEKVKSTSKNEGNIEEQLPSSANELRSRISQLVVMLGGKRALAEKAGIHESQLYLYLRGKTQPSLDSIAGLAKAANVTLGWLITGEPPISLGDYPRISLAEAASSLSGIAGGDEYTKVPKYSVKAGLGAGFVVNSEQIVDHLAFRKSWLARLCLDPDYLALIDCEGISMAPTILARDILLLDTRPISHINPGGIYAINIDDTLLVKRLDRLLNGSLVIISDNPAYPKQEMTPEDASTLRLVGRVVWFGRQI